VQIVMHLTGRPTEARQRESPITRVTPASFIPCSAVGGHTNRASPSLMPDTERSVPTGSGSWTP
jgi:hypothetical protein